ncbi:Nn.00g084090.m01.CDS01 [Neocucurbitaria sp. VM-36]
MSNNDINVAMGDDPMSTSNSTIPVVDTTPTVYDFSALSADKKGRIISLINGIGPAWQSVSAASSIPYKYHPDPDTRNWGIALLTALHRLAQMTRDELSFKEEAVTFVCDSIEERNLDLDVVRGDYVLRVEDIDYAIHQMRSRVNSYRPDYADEQHDHTAINNASGGGRHKGRRAGKRKRSRRGRLGGSGME